jgi:hypothetical protein
MSQNVFMPFDLPSQSLAQQYCRHTPSPTQSKPGAQSAPVEHIAPSAPSPALLHTGTLSGPPTSRTRHAIDGFATAESDPVLAPASTPPSKSLPHVIDAPAS